MSEIWIMSSAACHDHYNCMFLDLVIYLFFQILLKGIKYDLYDKGYSIKQDGECGMGDIWLSRFNTAKVG